MCGRLCPSRPTLDHLECIHRAACACNAIALVRIILLPALSWGNASTPAGRLRLPYPEALKLMWLDASVPAHLPTETVPLGMCRHPPQDPAPGHENVLRKCDSDARARLQRRIGKVPAVVEFIIRAQVHFRPLPPLPTVAVRGATFTLEILSLFSPAD